MSRVVFITGATGFIGNFVARRFASAGYQVYGLTRSVDKSKSLLQNEITPVIGDIENPETYEKIIEKSQIIIHCTSGLTKKPTEDDEAFVKIAAKASAKSPSKKLFIMTSGCLVYGGKIESDIYFNEDSNLNSPPGLGWRRKSELLVTENPDFIGVVTRPGFLYGGSGSYTGSYFSMVEAKKLFVVGNPEKKWAFIHGSDLAEGYLLIAEAPRSVVKGEVFNFGDGSRSTLREIVLAAGKIVGGAGEIAYLPAEKDFFGVNAEQNCLLDCSKARKLLSWVPKHFGFVENMSRYYATWKAYQN